MKKLIAGIAALMILVCGCAAFAEGSPLTREEAVQAALYSAGVKEDQATFTKISMDRDDGRAVWEIDFVSGGIEYELDIDALTGRVLECSKERYDGWDDDRYDWDDDRYDWDDGWFDFD